MGLEPMMRVLQTLALPLGHVAWMRCILAKEPGLVKAFRGFPRNEIIKSQ
jgi:hypothetical protein